MYFEILNGAYFPFPTQTLLVHIKDSFSGSCMVQISQALSDSKKSLVVVLLLCYLCTCSFCVIISFPFQVDVIESQWNILQARIQDSHDFTELVSFHQE